MDVGSTPQLHLREDLPINRESKNSRIAVTDVFPDRFLILLLLSSVLLSCSNRKELIDQPLYEGPMSSMDSIVSIMSDSGQFKMRIKASHQNDFDNGDTEWPDGIFVEFFNNSGKITTFFEANYVYYTKADKLYPAVGNVKVENYDNGDKLNTEELYWNETKEEYYTEKFVTINTDGEVHTGEGLEANQDFSNYKILKPSGTFTLEDDPKNPAPRDVPLPQPKKKDLIKKKQLPKSEAN